MEYRRIPKGLTLITFDFSSTWMTFLSRGRYFRIPNFVCECKEMSMTLLNNLESHGFFIVLLLHSAILPPSF